MEWSRISLKINVWRLILCHYFAGIDRSKQNAAKRTLVSSGSNKTCTAVASAGAPQSHKSHSTVHKCPCRGNVVVSVNLSSLRSHDPDWDFCLRSTTVSPLHSSSVRFTTLSSSVLYSSAVLIRSAPPVDSVSWSRLASLHDHLIFFKSFSSAITRNQQR